VRFDCTAPQVLQSGGSQAEAELAKVTAEDGLLQSKGLVEVEAVAEQAALEVRGPACVCAREHPWLFAVRRR
jgi:hypothetical protein